jgi:4-carboxymuconolactone decarboxylase
MDRMPPIAPEAMTPAQKAAAQQFRAKRGVDIDGPFVPLLRSPGLLEPLHQVGMHCRYNNALGLHLSEFIILNVARRFNQSVEWAIHAPIAEKAGVTPGTITAILEGRRPPAMTADQTMIYDAIREIWDGHSWSDTTYTALQNHRSRRDNWLLHHACHGDERDADAMPRRLSHASAPVIGK